MAGIFIWHKSQNFTVKKINSTFSAIGYKNGTHLNNRRWNVLVFPKEDFNIQNYLILNGGFICGTGTFAYKGHVYEKALPIIFNDIKNGSLNLTAFWGSFIIFLSIDEKVFIIRDGAALSRFHELREKLVFSNSFVGILRSSIEKLHFDKEAAIELLSTGLITGDSTLIKEIRFVSQETDIDQINIIYTRAEEVETINSRHVALHQQIDIVKSFIRRFSTDWLNYMPDSHLNASLTGGLDSRLLAALLLPEQTKLDFYSFWRENDSTDPDLRLAQNIASTLNIPLNFKKAKSAIDLNDEQLRSLFEEAHNSCDGVIRPGTFWDEEFSTINYRRLLSNSPFLRVTAFEGEYYRNTERLPIRPCKSIDQWVRWDMIYRFAGHNFTTKQAQKTTEDRIINNIKKDLGTECYNLLTYKEYYRKTVVPSYRSLQTNLENRYGFHESPFADTNLSIPAINAYKYLGNSLDFEIEMLKYLSPKLAALPNDYGFSFVKGEDNITKLSIIIWQAAPISIRNKLFSMYRKGYKNEYVTELKSNSPFIKTILSNVESLDLPINIQHFEKRNVRGRLLLNLGFFLEHNNNWLVW